MVYLGCYLDLVIDLDFLFFDDFFLVSSIDLGLGGFLFFDDFLFVSSGDLGFFVILIF